ncbi:DUF7453 family protein [Coleofasciculus sp. E1-EBD-02]|uniref:DUF7453 family protein n=1 Tax=Coleofasciculus sp. E1-EBD-02 TaxID=3068481 RepID=UPI0032F59EDA
MKHPMINHLSMATAVGLTFSLLATGNADAYTFSRIFDDSGPYNFNDYTYIYNTPAINNQGTVAFQAKLDLDQWPVPSAFYRTHYNREFIFTGDGASLNRITPNMGEFQIEDINDSNTVAFVEQGSSPSSPIFNLSTGNGGAFTTIATDSTSFFGDGILFGDVAINNQGSVAFREYDDYINDYVISIVTGDGARRTIMADDSGRLALNNNGTVAFEALLEGGGSGIFTSSSITPIADTNSLFKDFHTLSLNDEETLAFRASLDDGSAGIFTSSNGSLSTIADTGGLFSSFSSSRVRDDGTFVLLDGPAINNNGTVAFGAQLDTGEYGIFTGSDPVADKVIAIGDPLFGSTVTSLAFSNKGFNDAGEVAFLAKLADGSSGIFRAEPGDDGVVLDWGGTVTKPIPATVQSIGIDDFSGQEILVDYADGLGHFEGCEFWNGLTIPPHFIIDDVIHLGRLYDSTNIPQTNNITQPSITLNLAGSCEAITSPPYPDGTNVKPYLDGELLSVIFPELQNRLGFGFALSEYEGFPLDVPIDEEVLANAVTVKLFDAADNLLGTLSGDAQPDPEFLGGFFGIESNTPFLRAEITFNEGYEEFAFDNLRYELVTLEEPTTVPEPATGLGLLVISTIGAGSVLRHKQK